MLPLSFLVEVLFTAPLPMTFHAKMETCFLVIVILHCQSCVHLFPLPQMEAKAILPLLVGPTNKEDIGLFLLKVPLGSSKHVQQLWERGLNLVHVKVNNELRKGIRKRLQNKARAHLKREFNSEHDQPLDPLYHIKYMCLYRR